MNNGYEQDQDLANLTADSFGGNYLRQEDLMEPVTVTIRHARAEQLQGDERSKLVLYFEELEKPLVVNTTNREQLKSSFGNRIITWIGQRITLYVDKNVTYAGRRMGGIRVAAAPVVMSANPLSEQPSAHAAFANGPHYEQV